MAANLYLRGRTWWWRWRPRGQFRDFHTTILRVSLRTGCAETARGRSVQIEAMLDGALRMKHFEIGRYGLSKLYKAMTEEALDRIIGDRLSLPSPYHDRINLAHARLCALVAQHGATPSKNRLLIDLQEAGLANQDILDVLDAFDVYDGREIITDGKLAVHLKRLGVAAIAENLRRARPVGAAAMAQACLAATQECHSDASIALGLPLPSALAYLEPARSLLPSDYCPRPTSAPDSTICPGHVEDDVLDGPFSQVADAVIRWQLKEKLWDEKRGREVKASVGRFRRVRRWPIAEGPFYDRIDPLLTRS